MNLAGVLALLALALFCIIFGWSTRAYPQDCSKAVPIMNHPAEDIRKAQMRGTQKCEADEKRKGAAHRKSVQVLCKESADMQQTKAKRDEQYAACLRGHGYAK